MQRSKMTVRERPVNDSALNRSRYQDHVVFFANNAPPGEKSDVARTRKPKAKIVIVDDHPATRDGLALRISIESDLEVVGQAASIPDALQVIRNAKPDAAVIDISLDGGDGIDLIKRLKEKGDPVRILVWSMYEETLYAERALRAGALGYVNKRSDTASVVTAIQQILTGKMFLSAELSERLLNRLAGGETAFGQIPVDCLSDRELEVFRLLGHGKSTNEIASDMHLSPKTVETYRARIKEKLKLSSAPTLIQQATQWVLQNG
jgi:DNA-binding NarL/FixJ family response regulator